MTQEELVAYTAKMYTATCSSLNAALDQNATLNSLLEELRKERDMLTEKNRQLEADLAAAVRSGGVKRRSGGYW